MAEEHENQKKSPVKRHSYSPTICIFLLTGLNALFWFTADFRSFVPPSEGIFRERLIYFLVTELGPFSMVISENAQYDLLVFGIITLGLFISSTFIFCSRILGFVTCIAIFLWFLFGFAYAALRIT